MNKRFLIFGICGLFALAACNKNLVEPDAPTQVEPGEAITTDVIKASVAEEVTPPNTQNAAKPKVGYTAKEDAEGHAVFGATWSEGDVIYVTTASGEEEVSLSPFSLTEGVGETTGTFEGGQLTGSIFSAVYSSAPATVTEDNKIAVVFPAEQTYVENGLTANSIPMYAVGTDPDALKFNYGSGIIRLNLWSSEPATLSKIEIVTNVPASGTMLAAAGNADFPCGYELEEGATIDNMSGVALKSGAGETPANVITYTIPGGVELGADAEGAVEFNVAVAASNHCSVQVGENTVNAYESMIIRIYTMDGKVVGKALKNVKITAGMIHPFAAIGDIADMIGPSSELVRSTSSTLTYKWSQNGFTDAAADRAHDYKVALYSDASYNNLVVAWDLKAASALYRPYGEANEAYAGYPAFTFTGLAAGTDYYLKISDMLTGANHKADVATTATPATASVKIGDSKVAVGGIVLAEDFSEFIWGGDLASVAAGYTSTDLGKAFADAKEDNPTGFKTAKCSDDHNLFESIKTAFDGSRISDWCYAGKGGKLYGAAGYIRVGSGDNPSEIVTPVLSNLEEGKLATLTVKFKACPYYDSNNPAKADPDDAHITVIDGATGSISDKGHLTDHTYRVAANFNLEGEQNRWKEYSFDIPDVSSTSRISIGTCRPESAEGESEVQRRLFIDDIEISVKKYAEINAECHGETSSTLSFRWSGNGFTDAQEDANHPYTVALYEDEACSQAVVSFDIAKNASKSALDGQNIYHQPGFVFGGLEQGKDYWFKVTNTENNLESQPVKGTTGTFESVEVGAEVAEGAVALAEDFSQLVWGGDMVYKGLSYRANKVNSAYPAFSAATEETASAYSVVGPTADNSLFADYAAAVKGTRLEDWAHITNNGTAGVHLYARPGHLKLSKSSVWARLVTPALTNLRETATLTVKFKASPYYDHDLATADALGACVSVLSNTSERKTDGTIATYDEVVASEFLLKDIKNEWTEYECTVYNVAPGSHIAIGTNDKGSGKHRMFIDDIEIKVKKYESVKVPVVELQGATSSMLSFKWSENGFTNVTEDLAGAYRVALYTDDACGADDLVYAWDIDDNTKYSSLQPAFNFAGLAANTTYWCRVTNTATGIVSEPVYGTTNDFEVVKVGTTAVENGGIVLAEDFSELTGGGSSVYPGVSLRHSEFKIPSKDNTTGFSLIKVGDDCKIFTDYKTATDKLDRLKDWGSLSSATISTVSAYGRLDAIKVGTGSRTGMIVTPELKNLAAGKVAKIKVSFKASPYYENGVNKGLKARVAVFKNTTVSSFATTGTLADFRNISLKDEENVWNTYECTIEGVQANDRIAIGTYESGSYRMYIDDVVITVVDYRDAVAPLVQLQGATSSTLSFKWSENNFENVEADIAIPYNVELYKDAACTDLFVSWEISANNTNYKTTGDGNTYYHQPAFNFSGLAPNTTYYCRVTDMETGLAGEVVSGKTESFTVATVGDTKVEVGGTVLAEDFSILVWGGDFVFPGISSTKNTRNELVAATGVNPTADFKFANGGTEDQMYYNPGSDNTYGKLMRNSRLADWGCVTSHGEKPYIYARLGHVKLGTGGNWTRVVTPILSNLKGTATVKVAFKACPYYDHNQSGHDDLSAKITILTGTSRPAADNASYGKITATEETTAKEFNLTAARNVWTEYEYEISGVTPESRISIGAVNKTNNRMFIDDIVITVVSYNE